MKPYRLLIAHSLITNYGLYHKMEVFRPNRATFAEMKKFHDEDYVSGLRTAMDFEVSEIPQEILWKLKRYKIGTKENDCPLFDGLYDFCQMSSGASLAAAVNLNKGKSDIAINWAGGLHHAKKNSASGFCYVNDIVLGILELLTYHQRVLYVDLDIHHGDGVEEAFYTTDRVMTVSFHRFGKDFFPYTGGESDIGDGEGKYYSLNIPLKAGMDDESYEQIFVPIMRRVNEIYRPNVIVLQCGADSLAGDRLGDFNLTTRGHGNCVKLIRSFNVPMMMLGGGGYTVRNVSRCWTYETAIALNEEIYDDLPHSDDYFEYFQPNFKLHINSENDLKNKNSPQELNRAIQVAFEKLGKIDHVPSVQFEDISADYGDYIDEEVGELNPDKRMTEIENDKLIVPDNEFYDDY